MVEVDASSATEPSIGTVMLGASLASSTFMVNALENVFPPSSVERIVML